MIDNKKVWFITGVGRGMGAEFAKAALATGYQVVAAGRNTDKVVKVLGEDENLLIVNSDAITGAEQRVAELEKQINAYSDLSTSLAYEEA